MKKWLAVLLAVVIYVQTNSVKLGWDDPNPPGAVDHFEVVLIRDGTLTEYGPYGTSNTTISVSKPRSGSYEIRVRAVRKELDGSVTPSAWCSSLDSQCARLKDGTPGQFKVQWKPSSPLGPFIIK